MIYKTKRSNAHRYCVSPGNFGNTLVLLILAILSLVGVCNFAVCFDLTFKETIIGYIYILLFFSIPIFPCAFIARNRNCITYLYDDHIESKVYRKKKCSYAWNEIKYIRFVKSYNTGKDIVPVYIVLSKDEITPRKNMALTYDIKKEIVIRLTAKNIDNVMNYFSLMGIEPLYNNNFNVLNEVICNHGDILLKKLSNNTWEKEIRNRGE